MVASTSIQQITASRQSFPVHLDEWVKGSGVDETVAQLNLQSLDDSQQIAQLLNWKGYSGTEGWYVQGIDPLTDESRHFGQFKPNEPIQFPDADKPQKYLSFPKGAESEAIYLRVPLTVWQRIADCNGLPMPEQIVVTVSGEALGFWSWVLQHPELPLTLTEGVKKAACLLSCGQVAIALTGVWNGQKKKRTLLPSLKPFITVGRPVDLAFDADIIIKPEVQQALIFLGNLLNRAKAIVRIIRWDLQRGKGCDDFIVAQGTEQWEEAVDQATPYGEWVRKLELQFQDTGQNTSSGKGKNQPPPAVIGKQVAEEYSQTLCWSELHRGWMLYGHQQPGVWMPISVEFVNSIVDGLLDARGIDADNAYITNVVGKLQRKLYEPTWHERPTNEFLPFTDGVLELVTGQVHQHSPGFRLTWCLPRPYSVVGLGWTGIQNWLNEATRNHPEHIRVLLCFAAAVLRGRADLHKFLHLVGVGGTGKSTFANLLEALVGKENTATPTLRELETEKDVIAELQTKRLVIFPDEDGYQKMQNFKRLTGQDTLEGRYLYKNRVRFKFPGLAVVTSNGPIFKGVGGSWLTRRLVMVPFDYKPPASQVRNLMKEFEGEMSALTLHLLAIPDDEITRVLRGLGDGSVNSTVWEDRVRADSIAAFINEQIIHDPLAVTPIGDNKDEWKETLYNPSKSTLFGAYHHFCRISGLSHPVSKNNFSPNFIEVCQQTLNWEDVEKVRNSTGGRCLRGVRLRTEGDGKIPTPDDELKRIQEISNSDNKSDDFSDDFSDGFNSIEDKTSDNFDHVDVQKSVENQSVFEVVEESKHLEVEEVETLEVVEPASIETEQEVQVVSPNGQSGCQKVKNPIDPNHPLAQWLVKMPTAKTVVTAYGETVELPAVYPGRLAVNQTKEPLEIRQKALAVTSAIEWEGVVARYGYLCVVWVWTWLLTKAQKRSLTPILTGEIEQLELLGSPDLAAEAVVDVLEEGDTD